MKRLVLALALLGAASVASAQTATPGQSLGWDQPAPDLATAQAYTYKAQVDALPTVPLTAVCTAAVSGTPVGAFPCKAPFPSVTPGAHDVRVITSNVAGDSLPSTALHFTFVAIPGTPVNVRIQ